MAVSERRKASLKKWYHKNINKLRDYKSAWARSKRASLPKKPRKIGYTLTDAHKDNIRQSMLGKSKSLEARQKLSESRKGIKFSEEHRRKLSEAQKRMGTKPPSRRGTVPWNYRGAAVLTERIRKSFEYRQWRSDVYTRDRFKCQMCGIGGKLHAHHLKFFSTILAENKIETFEQALVCSELWNINNGLTVCDGCHKLIHGALGSGK